MYLTLLMNTPLIVCTCRQCGSAGPLTTRIVFVSLLSLHLPAQVPVGIYSWAQRMLDYYGPIPTHVHTKYAGINHYHLRPTTYEEITLTTTATVNCCCFCY